MSKEKPVSPASMERPAGAPRTRIKGPERRAKYLEAAARIVTEQGVSFVTMEEVAARTGVDRRLGYRYFPNRETLLMTLFQQQINEATRRAEAMTPDRPTLRDQISANIRAWLELANEHGPLLSRLFSDTDVIPEIAREMGNRAIRNWASAMQEALDLSPTVAETLSRIYLSALRGAVEALEAKMLSVSEVADIYTTATHAGAEAVAARSTQNVVAVVKKTRRRVAQ